MAGRPTDYTQELAQDICQRVMSKSLYKLLQEDNSLPNRDTIYNWLSKYKEFADNYARACTIRREERFESMDEIPDKEDDVQKARLKVDILKWQLSKEEPRKYGDKLDMTSNGKDLVIPILGGATKDVQSNDGNQEAC